MESGMRGEKEQARKLAALDAALDRGIADVTAGRMSSVDEAFDRVRQELGIGKKDRQPER
jgi:hypothetical protein